MTRSLPEKTFEHWCSIHLGYRYRAHMHQWWPSTGADIKIENIPPAYGKRIWLELKVPEWNAAATRHELKLDLVQLHKYATSPVPDYYVFPIPPWTDVLGAAASLPWLAGTPRSALAYQAQSGEQWFAEWSWVLPGHALRRAFAKRPKGVAVLAPQHGPADAFTWHGAAAARNLRRPMLWRDFLRLMEQCGDADWPAQFIVPAGSIPLSPASGGGSVARSTLASVLSSLRQVRDGHAKRPDDKSFSLFSPIDGEYAEVADRRPLGPGLFDEPIHDRGLLTFGVDALDV
ncbi:hypothetical protein [Gryllotalpicola sp.]|uniref:hypothetical protein n=1 Tax=Gryllotalpicola sp. TaxID=1932787 RepID=UPI0026124A20|nr:hypothetical protein [Gryllotalpicola sp.]